MSLTSGAKMVGLASEEAAREMETLLEKKEPPTGVICGTDVLASGVIRACVQRGVLVPDSVSVTGVGDGDFARHGVVPLTTVRFPSLGRLGFEAWKEARGESGEMRPQLAKGELVVRSSTAKANE